jgi:hypothetical protein
LVDHATHLLPDYNDEKAWGKIRMIMHSVVKRNTVVKFQDRSVLPQIIDTLDYHLIEARDMLLSDPNNYEAVVQCMFRRTHIGFIAGVMCSDDDTMVESDSDEASAEAGECAPRGSRIPLPEASVGVCMRPR